MGFEMVAGVDEVGRGALAGPVVAAAVILPADCSIDGVRDSKLVPEAERERLYQQIVESAICWSVGSICQRTIDSINILQATFQAIRQAVGGLAVRPGYVLVDGRDSVDVGLPCRAIIGGDAICTSIAAASLVAKVTRDRLLRLQDELMPEYGFARHKGYATAEHRRAIGEHGPSSFHRLSFLGRIIEVGGPEE